MNGVETAMIAGGVFALTVTLAWATNFVSYTLIKNRALRERRWDLNICCGTTDGGGINADIMRHADVPNFELVADVTRLPHPDGAFEHVLCSHTLEHVPDPRAFFAELRRVGRNVTVLIPPLWDFSAALNPFEHQVVFLTLRSRHENTLPPFVRYWPGIWVQRILGQQINADARMPSLSATSALIADLMVPVSFTAAAVMFFALHWSGVALGIFGFVMLAMSKRQKAPVASGT